MPQNKPGQQAPGQSEINVPALLEQAKRAACEAGQAILDIYNAPGLDVTLKADASPLTKADLAAHTVITRYLSATGLPILSEEGAQTRYEERRQWPWFWLVDPLDGTKEFIKRNGEFTVNIALMQQGKPVAGVIYVPCTDTLYYGSRETGAGKVTAGQQEQLPPLPQKTTFAAVSQQQGLSIVASRTHLSPETETFIGQFQAPSIVSMGSSLKFMLLAEGKANLYPRFAPTMEWDTAAAHAILNTVERGIYQTDLTTDLVYNKPDLHNPSFVSF
ncbi:3'(2'),5'-bisphosphate nucleotidase CysQ [Pontibacter actiniarum]|uniref:3'(2'),5'-bisphosphate nucleotidase CysQ n=1 Tax=Pontibacter actiniarum TaxID=323450 RepID=A0A1X9YRI6_9BACT|nr:3'(2'),5'-bisphosphate nucleotidase CysQ [Pontibacter actiniarum]ARS35487.1 3'(2'),5'-bisphosphate nucleotidase [Pontibacter actiniarum]